jgi:AraC-like DNA-binding protein
MEEWLNRISPCLRTEGLKVVGHRNVDRQTYESNWVEPLRTIYDHELVIFENGSFTVEIDGDVFVCPPNSFIIIPPGKLHLSATKGDEGGKRHWIHFDWVYSGPYVSKVVWTFHPAQPKSVLLRPAPPFVPARILHGEILAPNHVFDLHSRLYERWNYGSRHDQTTCRGLLLELLTEILDQGERKADPASPDIPLASKARQALYGLSLQPIRSMPSVQSILENLGYSYAHVCRLFRQAYGISPIAYINALRIERAKILMRDTQLKIGEIAERTGFETSYYFSRTFRKQTGQSPRRYMENARKEDPCGRQGGTQGRED